MADAQDSVALVMGSVKRWMPSSRRVWEFGFKPAMTERRTAANCRFRIRHRAHTLSAKAMTRAYPSPFAIHDSSSTGHNRALTTSNEMSVDSVEPKLLPGAKVRPEAIRHRPKDRGAENRAQLRIMPEVACLY
jgi:hypothetical protein